MCGFESDSTKTAFVCGPQRRAHGIQIGDVDAADLDPLARATSSRKNRVMMKTSSEATQWSPSRSRLKIVFATAAMPEEHATAASAPSSAATFSSSASVVGLEVRV